MKRCICCYSLICAFKLQNPAFSTLPGAFVRVHRIPNYCFKPALSVKLQFNCVTGKIKSLIDYWFALLRLTTDTSPRGIVTHLAHPVLKSANTSLSVTIRLISCFKPPAVNCVQDNLWVCASLYHADRRLYISRALAQCYLNDDEDWHDALYTVSTPAFVVASELTTTRIVIAAAITLRKFIISHRKWIQRLTTNLTMNFVGESTKTKRFDAV